MGNLTVNADYDPTLICCAWKKNRFYMFTRRKPDESIDDSGDIRNRDVFNEKPTREEIAAAVPMAKKSDKRASTGVIHTTMGDIHFKLFREEYVSAPDGGMPSWD
jgi:peptidylprolyl isomerase domain and WD repeat-containing protein 1